MTQYKIIYVDEETHHKIFKIVADRKDIGSAGDLIAELINIYNHHLTKKGGGYYKRNGIEQ